ncbi:hypothetical protein D3C86_1678890 [compost metagenome]
MRATRWAFSVMWREEARISCMVVASSFMDVACSVDADACWLAAARSSVEELWRFATASPIWLLSERVRKIPSSVMQAKAISVPPRVVPSTMSMLR